MKYLTLVAIAISGLFIACQSEQKAEDQAPDENYITDPHSFARPHEARITHMDLDLLVDFETRVLHGEARFTIENLTGTDKLYLDTRGLDILAVSMGEGQDPANFTLGESDPLLGTPLVVDILPDIKHVTISYQTSPDAAAVQWLTPAQTAGKRHPFLFTQSQAILARSWIPIQDGPGVRFTYTANVTVPKGLMAVMSASNPMERSPDGQYHFTMEQPIPAYLMALAIGDFGFKAVGPRTGVYAEPELLDAAAWEFADMEDMLVTAEDLYGKYVWDRFDVIVLPPSFPFGGMENPRITFLTPTVLAGDRSLTAIIAHELAHSWSGNLVTNATWDDFWLNEGFTTYFEGRIMEALYGKSYFEMSRSLDYQGLVEHIEMLKGKGQGKDTHLRLDLAGRDPDGAVGPVAYDKGALFLSHIEQTVGRERFDKFLKRWFDENAFGVRTTEDFVSYLNDELIQGDSALALKINAEAWIYGPGIPDDHPRYENERFRAIDAGIANWATGAPSHTLLTGEWSTHEWLYFLRNLPEDQVANRMTELDRAFKFTQSKNSEITSQWLQMAVRHNYEAAYPRLEQFLTEQGRRKFLAPLYSAMAATPEGWKWQGPFTPRHARATTR
jgi:leukotriene-A4 hydrolase